jgi:hypothetical protein
MTDPNLSDFYGRVARIQKARAKGYGFEAPGTLGRSFYFKSQTKRRSIIGPVVFLLVCAVLLKGVIYHSIGADSYTQRVASLQAGEGIERIGGWMMQAEPATLFVSDKITLLLAKMM